MLRAVSRAISKSRRSMATASFETSDRIAGEMNRLDVWSVFSPLSGYVPKDAINLGQGFMNWLPPKFCRDAVQANLEDVAVHHYSIPKGRIALRKALAAHYSESFALPEKRSLDVETEVLVTAGANEGIYAIMAAFLNKGDEVIVIEPYFDQYTSNITFNGGVPVFVPLTPPSNVHKENVSAADWTLDCDALEKAVTSKTKMILINTPHNPVGKVFSTSELEKIGKIAEKHNLIILSDEVYDCLAFEPTRHVRMAAIPNMWQRTITCGSAGKSFSATGWRIGWLIGPPGLIKPALSATTRIVFVVNSPLQEAVAGAFQKQGDFFEKQRQEYVERRDVLTRALDKLGLPYTIPDGEHFLLMQMRFTMSGAYFVLVSIADLKIPEDFETLEIIKDRPRDWRAAWFLAKTVGVVAIPPTDFYSPEHANIGENFIRLAFCKDVDTLKKGGERLQGLKQYVQSSK